MAGALDDILRLAVAVLAGIALGLDRELSGKPLGMRTLALVALGSAAATLAAIHFHDLEHASPQALARVLQGVLVGVLTGIGFIGAGVVLRDPRDETVRGLTTAATVWVTAALGIACALADWVVAITGVALALAILFGLGWVEKRIIDSQK